MKRCGFNSQKVGQEKTNDCDVATHTVEGF